MANGNGTTARWLGLIAGIILTITGWTIAGVNMSKAKQLNSTTTKIEKNEDDIGELQTQTGIVITELRYLKESIDEIKEILKEKK